MSSHVTSESRRSLGGRALKRALLAATACGSALIFAAPALAQENSQLEEVVVTARKRQESLLNVPVIATAVTQQQLERAQVREVRDLAKLVPGLRFGQSTGTSGVQISLRGVGTSTNDPAVDQTVSLNIDGLTLSQGLAYNSGVFDVGQVEVLKGPQALFYGKSSPGGVISLRTADPTNKFELIARGGYEFEAREKRGELIVSGPVTETLKLRFSGLYTEQDGFFHNNAIAAPGFGGLTPRHDRIMPSESHILRLTGLWTPSDRFDARLKINRTYDHFINAGAGQYSNCPDGLTPPPSGIPFLGGAENCQWDRNMPIVDMDKQAFPRAFRDGVPYLDIAQWYGSLEMNYRITPELTLTSTTGYYHLRSSTSFNGTSSTYAGPAIVVQTRFHRKDVSQELRLNSDFAGPLNFTTGAYYQDGEFEQNGTLAGNTFIRTPALLAASLHQVDIKTISAFGQGRWKVTPKLEVALGARWTDEERTARAFNGISGTYLPARLAVPKIESKNWSPELTVSYRPTDTVTVFGSLKQGYKSGSFNAGTQPVDGLDNSYGDEKVQGGEFGLKTRLLDRSLAIETAYYNYLYTGLQVGTSEPGPPGLPPVARTVNAGGARVYGIEFSAAYRPHAIRGLAFNLAANWNHGRFTTLTNIPCTGGQTIAQGCNLTLNPGTNLFTAQDLSGTRLARSPDFQANFGFDYEWDVGKDMSLTFANNNNYVSRYATALVTRDDLYQGSYLTHDISLTLKGPEERWELALIGKNIGNKIVRESCSASNAANSSILGGQITGGTGRGPAGVDEVLCRGARGREMWIRFTARPFN